MPQPRVPHLRAVLPHGAYGNSPTPSFMHPGGLVSLMLQVGEWEDSPRPIPHLCRQVWGDRGSQSGLGFPTPGLSCPRRSLAPRGIFPSPPPAWPGGLASLMPQVGGGRAFLWESHTCAARYGGKGGALHLGSPNLGLPCPGELRGMFCPFHLQQQCTQTAQLHRGGGEGIPLGSL